MTFRVIAVIYTENKSGKILQIDYNLNMKKRILIFLIAFTVSVSMISCSSGKTIETVAPTTSEPYVTESPVIYPEFEMSTGTVVYAWKGGAGTIIHDLDNDGFMDTIEFEFAGYDISMELSDKDIEKARNEMRTMETNSCTITVNGTSITIDGENMQGLVIISDIDSSDEFHELLIPEEGPSDDYMTSIIRFKGSDFRILGRPGGIPQDTLTADGSGLLKTTERGNILHTWFYDAVYTVQNSNLVELKENGYINMDHPVTALADLPLQVSPEDSTPAYTMKAGESVRLTWTDNQKWICVENADRLKGWFEVENFSYITILDKYAGEVFSDLSYAD